MGGDHFAYDAAFSRNIGWVTEAEQATLRRKRIAIAGMGGVGGGHLLTLARLGIGAFNIADFDTFDIVNFNRQAGRFSRLQAREVCRHGAINRMALRVSAGRVRPNLTNSWVDLHVDAPDFFAFDMSGRVRLPPPGIPLSLRPRWIGGGTDLARRNVVRGVLRPRAAGRGRDGDALPAGAVASDAAAATCRS